MDLANPLKKVNTQELAVAIPLGLALFIALTNLEGAAAGVFLVTAALCTLMLPLRVGMGILWLYILYLGFSHVSLAPSGLSNSRFLYLIGILFTLRALPELISAWRKGKKVPSIWDALPVILIGYLTLSAWRTSNLELISHFFLGTAALLLAREMKKPEGAKIAAWQLIALLFSVYLYYFMNRDVYLRVLPRFPGVRDANNFALFSNIALVLFNSFCTDVDKKWRIAVNCLLVVGVMITVSVSGLLSLAVIGIFYLPKGGRLLKAGLGTAAGVTAVGLVLYWTVPELLLSLGGFPARAVKILDALGKGDLDAVTTGRASLWEYYWDVFQGSPRVEKLFGNKNLIASRLVKGVLSPHNTYLNLLLDYGLMGLGLTLATVAHRSVCHIRRREYPWLLLSGLFLVNMVMRSFSGLTLYLFITL